MNAQVLLKQLDFIGAAVESNPVVPILECILVDQGQLISSNLRVTLLCKTDIEGTFLFPFKPVKKVVSMLPKDVDCKFQFDAAGERVTLQTPSGSFTFSDVMSEKDFPKPPQRQEEEIGILNSLDLHRIATVIDFTSQDELRPALCGVYINKQITATDGHRLAWFESSGSINEKSLLIDKLAARVLSGFGNASVRHDGGNIAEFHNNKNQVIITRLIEEKYPDYKNVIPTTYQTKVTIARESLLTAINLGIQMANKTTHQIAFDFKASNGVTITAKDLDFDTNFKHNINCVVDGVDIVIGFNGVLLKSVLTATDSEEITLKLTKPNSCGIINDSFLLMPVVIND